MSYWEMTAGTVGKLWILIAVCVTAATIIALNEKGRR